MVVDLLTLRNSVGWQVHHITDDVCLPNTVYDVCLQTYQLSRDDMDEDWESLRLVLASKLRYKINLTRTKSEAKIGNLVKALSSTIGVTQSDDRRVDSSVEVDDHAIGSHRRNSATNSVVLMLDLVAQAIADIRSNNISDKAKAIKNELTQYMPNHNEQFAESSNAGKTANIMLYLSKFFEKQLKRVFPQNIDNNVSIHSNHCFCGCRRENN